MELRHKFGILALLYVLSLSANLAMSGWCILVYFRSAFSDSQSAMREQNGIERLRAIARRQKLLLEEGGARTDDFAALREEGRALVSRLDEEMSHGPHAALWSAVGQAASQAEAAAAQRLSQGSSAPEWKGSFAQWDRTLADASTALSRKRESSVERAAATQQRVVGILILNSVVGAILCALGLVFVRRWVLRPVSDLRAATQQIARGNLDYRIAPRSGDELGQLAAEVNHMSATIAQMQTRLVEQERLAAAGEMVTRVAHNIRNPLAGIRGLAESTLQLCPPQPEVAAHQQRIIESVDRFEKWLRDLQQSVSPMTLNPQPTSIEELVESVTRALRPMADRRSVPLEVNVDPKLGPVSVDCVHFEQALVALITNAVQASPIGRPVRISAGAVQGHSDRWRLAVRDHGSGIPSDMRSKIFLPYFTTKPDGNGVGLAMVSKVVRIHGGHLTVDSEPGQGSTFAATMPGRLNGE